MRRLGSQRGQATIEYVAVIALLAVLLAATAGLSGHAPGIVNATLGQFRHALCVVTGASCPSVMPQPCTVASTRKTDHAALSLLFIRIDEDHLVLRERLSDGTVRLTVSESDGAGLAGGVGGRAELTLKGRTIGFEREASGAVQAVLGHGQVYLARNDREADEMLEAIRSGIPLGPLGVLHVGGHRPKPQSDFFEGGVRGMGRLGAGVKLAGASLDALADATLGASRNRKSGQVTVYLGGGVWGNALVSAMLMGQPGVGERRVRLMLTLDRHATAQQLAVEVSGTTMVGGALPFRLSGAAGTEQERAIGASIAGMTGRAWELYAQVDLHDPVVAAAWRAFRHDPTSADAIRALAASLRDESQLSMSHYAVDSQVGGAALEAAAGLKLGVELGHATDRARLLTAAFRPPGGLWERRFDCLPA